MRLSQIQNAACAAVKCTSIRGSTARDRFTLMSRYIDNTLEQHCELTDLATVLMNVCFVLDIKQTVSRACDGVFAICRRLITQSGQADWPCPEQQGWRSWSSAASLELPKLREGLTVMTSHPKVGTSC